jgi:hypothetical protein
MNQQVKFGGAWYIEINDRARSEVIEKFVRLCVPKMLRGGVVDEMEKIQRPTGLGCITGRPHDSDKSY